ncbi:MAG: hypothetical protein E7654_05810 [Ruminococcaceae bacterium]|nr:hypothetical protein [Oscillospiraceae bacterium]
MKKIVALMLLLCLVAIPACANENANAPDMPETHAAAIDPDKVKTVRLVRLNENGEEDYTALLQENNLAIPLLATVFDTAAEAKPAAERRCDIRGTMRMSDGSEIVFEVFTDDTMETGGAVLEGAKMRQFIYSFVPGFASVPETTDAADAAEGAEG